jgi:UDP-galactopyranose mutase
MNYDLIIVGSGFSGATIAYQGAKCGKRVLILEKRNHIAGNMYDFYNQDGILVQKYGPHSFHTNRQDVYEFITSIGDWEDYTLRARVVIDGTTTPSPFNFHTIDTFYPKEDAEVLKQTLQSEYPEAKTVSIVDMLHSENEVIRQYALFLFEKDYRPYTAKQWGIAPEELDISVLKRVPVRLSYVDRYFDDRWQLLPQEGYTSFFQQMLSHPNIEIRLNCNAVDHITLDMENRQVLFDKKPINIPIVYTGPLDELMHHKYGVLPYRSLRFEFKTLPQKSYQETAGVAHPMEKEFTRITEYTKLPYQDVGEKTTIAIEYPMAYGETPELEPYYPILTKASQQMYQQYAEDARKIANLYLCGRLANFRYFNMDDAIAAGLEVYQELEKGWKEKKHEQNNG